MSRFVNLTCEEFIELVDSKQFEVREKGGKQYDSVVYYEVVDKRSGGKQILIDYVSAPDNMLVISRGCFDPASEGSLKYEKDNKRPNIKSIAFSGNALSEKFRNALKAISDSLIATFKEEDDLPMPLLSKCPKTGKNKGVLYKDPLNPDKVDLQVRCKYDAGMARNGRRPACRSHDFTKPIMVDGNLSFEIYTVDGKPVDRHNIHKVITTGTKFHEATLSFSMNISTSKISCMLSLYDAVIETRNYDGPGGVKKSKLSLEHVKKATGLTPGDAEGATENGTNITSTTSTEAKEPTNDLAKATTAINIGSDSDDESKPRLSKAKGLKAKLNNLREPQHLYM